MASKNILRNCMWAGGAAVGILSTKFLVDKNTTQLASSVENESETSASISRHEMALKTVQVFFRHGARTPIRQLAVLEELDAANWDESIFQTPVPHTDVAYVVTAMDGELAQSSHMNAFYKTMKFKGGCQAGSLTSLGRDQAYALGRELRRRYMHNRELLTSTYNDSDVYIRSTNMERTVQSLQCVMAGLYGKPELLQNGPIKIPVSDYSYEVLFPNQGNCPYLRNTGFKYSRHSVESPNVNATRMQLQNSIGYEEDEEDKRFPLQLIQWRDNIVCRLTHGLPIPAFLQSLSEKLDEDGTQIMVQTFCGSGEEREKMLRLSTGSIWNLMQKNISKVIRCHESSRKLYLFSCHDSTLLPLLVALGIFKDEWPPYCADLTFETYQDRSGTHWLRVLYCGKEQTVKGFNSPLMEYKRFQEFISQYSLTYEQRQKLCREEIDEFSKVTEAVVEKGTSKEEPTAAGTAGL